MIGKNINANGCIRNDEERNGFYTVLYFSAVN